MRFKCQYSRFLVFVLENLSRQRLLERPLRLITSRIVLINREQAIPSISITLEYLCLRHAKHLAHEVLLIAHSDTLVPLPHFYISCGLR